MNQDELHKEETVSIEREEASLQTDTKHEDHFPVEDGDIDTLKFFSFGGIVIIGLCVFFSFINMKRGSSFYDYGAIIFVYIASTLWRAFLFTRNKYYLLLSCLGALGVIVCVFRYIVLV